MSDLRTQIAELAKSKGSQLSSRFGRDAAAVRWARPVYDSIVGWIAGNRGVNWSINGIDYRIDIQHRSRMAHEYEPPVADFLRDLIKPGFLCFDVGANVGVYALQFCQWSAPSGRVVAFEPSPAARRVLERHVAMNRLKDRVQIVPAAVGSHEDQAVFFAAGADGMSRLETPNPALAHQSQALTVPVVTVDGFVATTGNVPDLILIDVEGFELAVLEGCRQIITSRRRKTHLVVEMHPSLWPSAHSSGEKMAAFLSEMQLRPRCLTGQQSPLEEYGLVYLESL